jgi:hypothetical protein
MGIVLRNLSEGERRLPYCHSVTSAPRISLDPRFCRGSSHSLRTSKLLAVGPNVTVLRQCSRPQVLVAKKSKTAPPARSYKHADRFKGIPGCPPKLNANFMRGGSFRIVHKDIKDPRNFRAPAEISPQRFTKKDAPCQCRSWALSLFERRVQLKKHVTKVEQNSVNFRKIVGDHGVLLKLTDAHGRRTKAARNGHFSFFEFDDFEGNSVVAELFPLFESS